jgi:hypothetical protein
VEPGSLLAHFFAGPASRSLRATPSYFNPFPPPPLPGDAPQSILPPFSPLTAGSGDSARPYSSSGKKTTYAIRFKTAAIAQEFSTQYKVAQQENEKWQVAALPPSSTMSGSLEDASASASGSSESSNPSAASDILLPETQGGGSSSSSSSSGGKAAPTGTKGDSSSRSSGGGVSFLLIAAGLCAAGAAAYFFAPDAQKKQARDALAGAEKTVKEAFASVSKALSGKK